MVGTRTCRFCFEIIKNHLFKDYTCATFQSLQNVNDLNRISYSVVSRLPFNVYCRRYQVGNVLKKGKPEITKRILDYSKEKGKQEDKEETTKLRQDANKKTKYMLIAMGSLIALFGGSLVFSLGAPRKDEEGNDLNDAFSSLPVVTQYWKRTVILLEKLLKHPSRDKLLPDPLPYPYQPPYTLVLELKDLLMHPEWTYETGWRFKKRPGVDQFLEQVSRPYFEIVVFTADSGMTMYPIVNLLDPNGFITYQLFRDSTDFCDGEHVKNLDHLNRDLSKVIVVDWNLSSVKLHPENTLVVPRWAGNDDDTQLADLAVFLQTIATSDVTDVRDVINHYSQFENPLEEFRNKQRLLMEQIEEKERQKKQKNSPFTSRWNGLFPKN